MKKKSLDKTKLRELFFISSPIGILTGLIRDNKLYSLSGQDQYRNFYKTLKSLDKTYFVDPSRDQVLTPSSPSSPSPLVKKIKKEINLFFKGELKSFDIPLYKRGTPFQQKVWKSLQKIPYGQTKTYSETAKRIQKPKAYRAVGACCAKNPYLIVVPCHRVLSQKSLGGFALGLKVKKQLLSLELLNLGLLNLEKKSLPV